VTTKTDTTPLHHCAHVTSCPTWLHKQHPNTKAAGTPAAADPALNASCSSSQQRIVLMHTSDAWHSHHPTGRRLLCPLLPCGSPGLLLLLLLALLLLLLEGELCIPPRAARSSAGYVDVLLAAAHAS
jgi:hypothetical protein